MAVLEFVIVVMMEIQTPSATNSAQTRAIDLCLTQLIATDFISHLPMARNECPPILQLVQMPQLPARLTPVPLIHLAPSSTIPRMAQLIVDRDLPSRRSGSSTHSLSATVM